MENLTETGYVKIKNYKNSSKFFSHNNNMIDMVQNGKIYPYKRYFSDSKKLFAFKVNGYHWMSEDLIFVDKDGNEIEKVKIEYPEPQQFDTKNLHI